MMGFKELEAEVNEKGSMEYESKVLGVRILLVRDDVYKTSSGLVSFSLRELKELMGQPPSAIKAVYECKKAFMKKKDAGVINHKNQLAFEFLKMGEGTPGFKKFVDIHGGIEKVKQMADEWRG
jgi:hypothetical protein